MNQIQAMRVFVQVIDLGSFAHAARQLNLSAAVVTRSVGLLEQHLSMRLINRSTRKLSLTDAGRQYFEGCREVIQQLDRVEADLKRATKDTSGILRVAVSTLFAHDGIGALLAEYRKGNPGATFDVSVFDGPINMIEGGFDVCFNAGRYTPPASLVSRSLLTIKDVLVATPMYLSRYGTPDHPRALVHHELLTILDAVHPLEFQEDGQRIRISKENTFRSANRLAVREAALGHMGIARVPRSIVAADIAKGTLRPVLEGYDMCDDAQELSLIYTGRNYLTMRVRGFVDFVMDYFRSRDAYPVPLRVVA
ncbi:LysR family transcriptional regulator [Paraburkholderia caribensis]|uniref:LysR family transcriptional regulator n=1 Tax=Paraburkholderia caribensis TaxID=75105 RepID=UPI00071EC10F|nr:LysR family transcriptional regulator [Paraburkholderia caribensis]ALP68513.1 hypothetical protein AN416_37930 [Paraburkholderia caribensis]AUT57868.1 LysR family transcriptional regulator [Paraburkholderia caribensis]